MNPNDNETSQQPAKPTDDVWLPVPASQSAQNTVNPIRRIVDRVKITPNPSKAMIALSIGDPTHYGNMLPPIEALEAVADALQSPTAHGYAPSFGRSFTLPLPVSSSPPRSTSRFTGRSSSSGSVLVAIKLHRQA